MNNYIDDANDIRFTAGANVASGQVVVAGSIIGVATDAVANTQSGALRIRGKVRIPKATGVAFTVGQKLIWDHTAGNLRATGATTGMIANAAIASAAAASGDTTAEVILNPFFSTVTA
jgi:predicted RecA/RadA family phage recombinase